MASSWRPRSVRCRCRPRRRGHPDASHQHGVHTEGLDAARVIRDEFPETGILVLSAHVDVEHAIELLASGERIGYLLKNRLGYVDEFIETVERIARGGSVVDPVLVMELVSARREGWILSRSSPAALARSSPSWLKGVRTPASQPSCG